MIKLFHRDIVTQAVLIVAALLLLWGPALLVPPPVEVGDHPAVLYGLVCKALTHLPRLAVAIAMLLVLAEGVMLNLLLANVNLVSQNSLLPTLLYIIAMSAGTACLTPLILINGAVIACLHYLLLRGTLLTIPPEKICGATLLIGVATMCYQPALLLMLSYLLIASSYRLYDWKDWMLMLLGFAAPYLLLVTVLYLTNGLSDWWNESRAIFTDISLRFRFSSLASTLATLFLAVVFLWSLFSVLGRMGERPVVWQRNASTVLLIVGGGLGMLFFNHFSPASGLENPIGVFSCLAVPFAFALYRLLAAALEKRSSYGRGRKQRSWPYDLLLTSLLIAAILC